MNFGTQNIYSLNQDEIENNYSKVQISFEETKSEETLTSKGLTRRLPSYIYAISSMQSFNDMSFEELRVNIYACTDGNLLENIYNHVQNGFPSNSNQNDIVSTGLSNNNAFNSNVNNLGSSNNLFGNANTNSLSSSNTMNTFSGNTNTISNLNTNNINSNTNLNTNTLGLSTNNSLLGNTNSFQFTNNNLLSTNAQSNLFGGNTQNNLLNNTSQSNLLTSTNTQNTNLFGNNQLGSLSKSFAIGQSSLNTQTLGSNLNSNLNSNLGSNINSNLGSNIGSNLGSNLSSNLNSNLGSNLGSNINSNLGNQNNSFLQPQLNQGLNFSTGISSNTTSSLGDGNIFKRARSNMLSTKSTLSTGLSTLKSGNIDNVLNTNTLSLGTGLTTQNLGKLSSTNSGSNLFSNSFTKSNQLTNGINIVPTSTLITNPSSSTLNTTTTTILNGVGTGIINTKDNEINNSLNNLSSKNLPHCLTLKTQKTVGIGSGSFIIDDDDYLRIQRHKQINNYIDSMQNIGKFSNYNNDSNLIHNEINCLNNERKIKRSSWKHKKYKSSSGLPILFNQISKMYTNKGYNTLLKNGLESSYNDPYYNGNISLNTSNQTRGLIQNNQLDSLIEIGDESTRLVRNALMVSRRDSILNKTGILPLVSIPKEDISTNTNFYNPKKSKYNISGMESTRCEELSNNRSINSSCCCSIKSCMSSECSHQKQTFKSSSKLSENKKSINDLNVNDDKLSNSSLSDKEIEEKKLNINNETSFVKTSSLKQTPTIDIKKRNLSQIESFSIFNKDKKNIIEENDEILEKKLRLYRDNKNNEKNIGKKCKIILERDDYYTQPSIWELDQICTDDDKCIVKGFVIGRKEYGYVTFPDEINVYGLNLDEIVFFDQSSIEIYPDDYLNKPPQNEGLNRRAIITLNNIYINNNEIISRGSYIEYMEKLTLNMNAIFLDYNPTIGTWTFEVEHFTKYGIDGINEINESSSMMVKSMVIDSVLNVSTNKSIINDSIFTEKINKYKINDKNLNIIPNEIIKTQDIFPAHLIPLEINENVYLPRVYVSTKRFQSSFIPIDNYDLMLKCFIENESCKHSINPIKQFKFENYLIDKKNLKKYKNIDMSEMYRYLHHIGNSGYIMTIIVLKSFLNKSKTLTPHFIYINRLKCDNLNYCYMDFKLIKKLFDLLLDDKFSIFNLIEDLLKFISHDINSNIYFESLLLLIKALFSNNIGIQQENENFIESERKKQLMIWIIKMTEETINKRINNLIKKNFQDKYNFVKIANIYIASQRCDKAVDCLVQNDFQNLALLTTLTYANDIAKYRISCQIKKWESKNALQHVGDDILTLLSIIAGTDSYDKNKYLYPIDNKNCFKDYSHNLHNLHNLHYLYYPYWINFDWVSVFSLFLFNYSKNTYSISKVFEIFIDSLQNVSKDYSNSILFTELGKDEFSKFYSKLCRSLLFFYCNNIEPLNEIIDDYIILNEEYSSVIPVIWFVIFILKEIDKKLNYHFITITLRYVEMLEIQKNWEYSIFLLKFLDCSHLYNKISQDIILRNISTFDDKFEFLDKYKLLDDNFMFNILNIYIKSYPIEEIEIIEKIVNYYYNLLKDDITKNVFNYKKYIECVQISLDRLNCFPTQSFSDHQLIESLREKCTKILIMVFLF